MKPKVKKAENEKEAFGKCSRILSEVENKTKKAIRENQQSRKQLMFHLTLTKRTNERANVGSYRMKEVLQTIYFRQRKQHIWWTMNVKGIKK